MALQAVGPVEVAPAAAAAEAGDGAVVAGRIGERKWQLGRDY